MTILVPKTYFFLLKSFKSQAKKKENLKVDFPNITLFNIECKHTINQKTEKLLTVSFIFKRLAFYGPNDQASNPLPSK